MYRIACAHEGYSDVFTVTTELGPNAAQMRAAAAFVADRLAVYAAVVPPLEDVETKILAVT